MSADKSGHGRASRPEILTMRAASQRLNRLVTVQNMAAASGLIAHNPAVDHAQASLDALLISSEIRHGRRDNERTDRRRPDDQATDGVPFAAGSASVDHRPSEHR